MLQVARAVGINLLLLSSINTADVTGTWRHLGFVDTSAEQLAAFGVDNDDLMHMDNTQQVGGTERSCWQVQGPCSQCLGAPALLPAVNVCFITWTTRRRSGALAALVADLHLTRMNIAFPAAKLGDCNHRCPAGAWTRLCRCLPPCDVPHRRAPARARPQMHKFVPPPARFKPLVIRHGHFSQRTYLPLDYRPSDSRPSASLARPSGGAPAYSQGAAYSHGAASSRLSTDSSASQMDASQYQECDEGDMDGDGDAAMDDAAATGQAQSAAPQQR